MISPTVDNPVGSPVAGTACVYVCCPWCEHEWYWQAAPPFCPDCGERTHAGKVGTALRRIQLANGL